MRRLWRRCCRRHRLMALDKRVATWQEQCRWQTEAGRPTATATTATTTATAGASTTTSSVGGVQQALCDTSPVARVWPSEAHAKNTKIKGKKNKTKIEKRENINEHCTLLKTNRKTCEFPFGT